MPHTEGATIAYHPTSGPALTKLAYSIPNAAEALSISRSRLYQLLEKGEISSCKIGKRTVIQASELIGFLDRHRVERLAGMTPTLDGRGRHTQG
jgi:excisionase family DNA binding protein